ncbi:MAG: hypothetical protein EHM28_00370 [Spirochaetaceae bacterium]|nr:MAG: hypothetical protein EHM28_00370 [Spirochaetaceae bacterium]
MLKKYGAVFAFLIINLAGIAAQNNPAISEIEKNYKFHTVTDFIEIMEKSSISYTLAETPAGSRQFSSFGIGSGNPVSPSSYMRLVKKADGTYELKDEPPQGDMKFLLDQGVAKIEAGNAPAAIPIFQKATQLDPNYFKAWSFLALGYLNVDQPVLAIEYFKKAISINSIGFEEHHGLAMAYYRITDYENALESITTAFIYNRYDSVIRTTLGSILQAKKLWLYKDHMVFPFSIEKISDSKCNIYTIGPNSENWAPMAMATAVWSMEPEFKKIDAMYAAAGRFNSIKLYDIFLCQHVAMIQQLANKATLNPQEKRFFDIINDGYLLQVILWDIIGASAPDVVFLMKPEEMKKLRDYVKKYVFVPA